MKYFKSRVNITHDDRSDVIVNSTDSSYKKDEKRIIKYHHKLLLADLLYVNYVHSNF